MLQNFLESRDPLLLDFGDNPTVSPRGHLIICEDKGQDIHINHLKIVNAEGRCFPFARNPYSGSAAFAGICHSPNGTTMFVHDRNRGASATTMSVRVDSVCA